MTQAVAKKQNTFVTPVDVVKPAETILKSDVVIPKVLLMQGLSELVADGGAKMGDMVRSTTGELLGNPSKPVEIIPLTFRNTWVITELVGGKYEFRGFTERNAKNEQDPWEFTENGTQWKRAKSIDLFALLPADITAELAEIKKYQETGEMPDLNKTLLPVAISFRVTSFKAGRTVATHFTQALGMAKYGVKPYGFTLKLGCVKQTNDKGTFYTYEVKPGAKVSKEVLERAAEWYDIVATRDVKVDEESEAKTASADTSNQF